MKLPATPAVYYLTTLFFFFFFFFFFCITATFTTSSTMPLADDDSGAGGSIIFATLGSKSSYSFDIYSLQIHDPNQQQQELRLTDGNTLNYNGHWDPQQPNRILYVTERQGSSAIYSTTFYDYDYDQRGRRRMTALLPQLPTESTHRVHVPVLDDHGPGVSMKDRPSLAGEFLLYVSTHEDPAVARTSWAAVYSTHLTTGLTWRLTPYGVADFSPAASPSGVWTAVASLEGKGWGGEVEELGTDIYVFLTRDGSSRVKVVEHGGWPSWVDESTFYFHRRGEDGWWSVYKAILVTKNGQIDVDSVVTQRVTPPGLHSFTPSACVANKSLIAVATRRPGSDYRHIELYDVVLNKFIKLTQPVSPNAHHFSPFFSPNGVRVGYHKCRGSTNTRKSDKSFFLENMRTPTPEIPLFRIDGSFPSFSPDGSRIAYVNFPGLFIVNADGSDRRKVNNDMVFGTAWDRKRKGVVYTSSGPTFETESTEVDIISVDVENEEISYKKLTRGGKNNAFPSPSPDGKWVVFRSGRTGHKNLYIMDAVDGETGALQRLTEGPWSDTMCSWSPDGDWIAFASDRDNPGSGSFALYLIHPNGTGLHKLVQSGSGGRTNHPYFSPDGKQIVFTSDYSAVSAEPISNPHQYQPYGEIYTINTDGSELKRLTHNSFEDGTPAWGPRYMKPVDVEWAIDGPECSFEDLEWLKISSPKASLKDAFFGSLKIQCSVVLNKKNTCSGS